MRFSNCANSAVEGGRIFRSILCPTRLIGIPVLTSSATVGFSAGGVGDLAAVGIPIDAETGVSLGGTEMDELVRLAGGVSSVSS